MRLACAALIVVTSVAEARPKCPSPRIHTHRSLAAARASLGSVTPLGVPELADKGTAFFVDVPVGSPEGEDSVNYKVAAIFLRRDQTVVVVDDLARWLSVIPQPGHQPSTTPAQSIRVDGPRARLKIDGLRDSLVDVARAKFLGCPK